MVRCPHASEDPRPPCPAATGCTRTTRPVRRAESARPTARLVPRSTHPCRPPPSPPARPPPTTPLSPAELLAITRELAQDHETWRALAQHTPARALVHPSRRPRRPRRVADRLGLVPGRRPPRPRWLERRALRGRRRAARDVHPARGRRVPRGAAPPGRHRAGVRSRTRAPGREPVGRSGRRACTCTRRRS